MDGQRKMGADKVMPYFVFFLTFVLIGMILMGAVFLIGLADKYPHFAPIAGMIILAVAMSFALLVVHVAVMHGVI